MLPDAFAACALRVTRASPSPPNIIRGRMGRGTAREPGEFGFPVSVAVHGTGNVYVADSENDRIPALRHRR